MEVHLPNVLRALGLNPSTVQKITLIYLGKKMEVERFGERLKISVDANKTSKAQQRRIQFDLVMPTGVVL